MHNDVVLTEEGMIEGCRRRSFLEDVLMSITVMPTLSEALSDAGVPEAESVANVCWELVGGKEGAKGGEEFIAAYKFDFQEPAKLKMNPYYLINDSLRSGATLKLYTIRKFIFGLLSALRKLPCKYFSVVYRGISVCLDMSAGDVWEWPGFTSTSLDANVAKRFFGFDETTKTEKGTLFEIHDAWGYDLRAVSSLKGEQEVLLEPGTRVLVSSLTPGCVVNAVVKFISFTTPLLENRIPLNRKDEVDSCDVSGYNEVIEAKKCLGLGMYEEAKKHLLNSSKAENPQAKLLLAHLFLRDPRIGIDVPMGIKLLCELVSVGIPEACVALGRCYKDGWGVAKDMNKAIELYVKGMLSGAAISLNEAVTIANAAQGESSVIQRFQTAFSSIERQALADDPGAKRILGDCRMCGIFTAKDEAAAFDLYKQGADGGHAKCMSRAGLCLKLGKGTKVNIQEAVRLFEKGAGQGDALCQYELGMCLLEGVGVSRDDTAGFEVLLKSAEQGNMLAQRQVGLCYKNGKGTLQSVPKAVEWFHYSAIQGEVESQNELGNCYYDGVGTSVDFAAAAHWYQLSALQENADGQNWLGCCYQDGTGVQRNPQEGVCLFCEAAQKGHLEAMHNLGFCLVNGWGVQQNAAEGFKWILKAAEKGFDKDYALAGYSYITGTGTDINLEQAFKWYMKAAEAGFRQAMAVIGACYYEGKGVAKNDKESFAWFLKAAEKGSRLAMQWVSSMYKKGVGVEVNETKAKEWADKVKSVSI